MPPYPTLAVHCQLVSWTSMCSGTPVLASPLLQLKKNLLVCYLEHPQEMTEEVASQDSDKEEKCPSYSPAQAMELLGKSS